jgi:SAM-dependent methyltransferase
MSDRPKEADIRPVAETNHICDVVYPQAAAKFLDEVDRSTWVTHERCPVCACPAVGYLFTKVGFDHAQCPRCGHQFVNPMPDHDAVAHWYATSEHQKAFNKLIERVGEQRREILYKKRLAQLLEACAFDSILEIGCGTGGFLRHVKSELPDVKVYGCDLGADAVAIAREHGVEAIHGAAEDFDYERHRPDVVVLYEVIEHLVEPERVLRSVRAGLSSGAHLVMSTPNNEGFDFRTLGKTYRGYMPPGHLHLFGLRSMRTLLERLGFVQVDVRGNGRLDANIVKSYYENNRFLPDHFWKAVFDAGDDAFLADFQDLLVKHGLSGNMMIHAVVP